MRKKLDVNFVREFVTERKRLRHAVYSTCIYDPTLFTGGRFVVTSQGDLHIRAARPEDGRATYSCLTLHALTSERRRSEPATLTVTGNQMHFLRNKFEDRFVKKFRKKISHFLSFIPLRIIL